MDNAYVALIQCYERLRKPEAAEKYALMLGTMRAEQGDQSPFLVYRGKPKFPDKDIPRSPKASVDLVFDIDTKGRPFNIRISDSNGSIRYRGTATKMVEGLRFVPAFKDGVPIVYRDYTQDFSYNRVRPNIEFRLLD